MSARFLLLIFCLSLLTACGSQPTTESGAQPVWVTGSSDEYPRNKYLLGVGQADTMDDAKTRARNEIAKIFSVTVVSTSSDHSRFDSSRVASISVAGLKGSQESLSVEREIISSTNQLLEGVDIAETWKDNVRQRYYALAVLPRLKTSLTLGREIEGIDSATQTIIQYSRSSTSLVKKIRTSAKAIQLQKKRHALSKQLNVVALVTNETRAPWSVDKLIADYSVLVSRITINPVVRGQQQQAMEATLANTLANQGFSVYTGGDYTVTATLNTTALPEKNGWHYNKANLTISMSDKSSAILGGHEWNYKVSATDKVLTDVRVIKKAKELLDSELNNTLFKILEIKH